MAAFLRKRRHRGRSRESGQTVIEWLLLMALTFIIGYFVVTQGIGPATHNILLTLRSFLGNMIQNGSLRPGQLVQAGEADHPSAPSHFKPTHN